MFETYGLPALPTLAEYLTVAICDIRVPLIDGAYPAHQGDNMHSIAKLFSAVLFFVSLSASSMVITNLQGVSALFSTNGFLLHRLYQAKDVLEPLIVGNPPLAWEKITSILAAEGYDTLTRSLAIFNDTYIPTMSAVFSLLENQDYVRQARYVFDAREFLKKHPEEWSGLDYTEPHHHLPLMLVGEDSRDRATVRFFLSYLVDKDYSNRPQDERERLKRDYHAHRPLDYYPTSSGESVVGYAADTTIMPTIIINGINQIRLEKRLSIKKEYKRSPENFALVSQWLIYENENLTPDLLREEVQNYRTIINEDDYYGLPGQREVLRALGKIFLEDKAQLLGLNQFNFLTEEAFVFYSWDALRPVQTNNYRLLKYIDDLVDEHMRNHSDKQMRKFLLTEIFPTVKKRHHIPFFVAEYINRFVSQAHELAAVTKN